MKNLIEALVAALAAPNADSFVKVSRRVAGLITRCYPQAKVVWCKFNEPQGRKIAYLPTGAVLVRTRKHGVSTFYLKCNWVDNIDGRKVLRQVANML
jgi:hypothetical protein